MHIQNYRQILFQAYIVLCLAHFMTGDALATDNSIPLPVPCMSGPLAPNPTPLSMEAGDLGKIYMSGIVSGLGLWQDHAVPNDHSSQFDLSNAQLFIQKADGPLQFYVQAGEYILPAVGALYQRAAFTTEHFFGPVPIAYVKFAPTDNFSVMAGKLYTLIGTENTFDFQNGNVQHGLLWNQTNDLSRGVQVNYAHGGLSGSLALTDGFYSGELNWLSGALTYTFNQAGSITLLASGNIHHDSENSLATPLALNNSQLVQLNYAYTTGPWTVSPTLQYTHVPEDTAIGLTSSASTYGAALLAKYMLDTHWNLSARTEYITSEGGMNVMYGPGSSAWSLTVTPTYQQGIFFARPEVSYVKATHVSAGEAFGTTGTDTAQARLLVETGILF